MKDIIDKNGIDVYREIFLKKKITLIVLAFLLDEGYRHIACVEGSYYAVKYKNCYEMQVDNGNSITDCILKIKLKDGVKIDCLQELIGLQPKPVVDIEEIMEILKAFFEDLQG